MNVALKEFVVFGPFSVPLEPNKNAKMVARDLSAFWKTAGACRDRRGVYVFAMRAGRGFTPIYVGKAAKQSYENEAFSDHKLANHYNPALLEYERGSPVMFFIAHPKTKGAVNKSLIDKVETFLIDIASRKNPELSNIRKKQDHEWRIRGVVRGRKGEGTKSSGLFALAVGLA